MATAFIRHPGLSGPFGALMDEYARAAEDFCRVAEHFDLPRFDATRPSNNPNTVSPRAICLHVIGAAHRYALSERPVPPGNDSWSQLVTRLAAEVDPKLAKADEAKDAGGD